MKWYERVFAPFTNYSPAAFKSLPPGDPTVGGPLAPWDVAPYEYAPTLGPVNYAVNPSDLNFVRTSDGKVHGDIDLIIFVYTPAGELINALQQDVHLTAPLEDLRKAVAQGLLWHEEISAPAKGEYFLRIAVRDEHKDRYGAVEMATSDVRSVRPAEAPPAPVAGAEK